MNFSLLFSFAVFGLMIAIIKKSLSGNTKTRTRNTNSGTVSEIAYAVELENNPIREVEKQHGGYRYIERVYEDGITKIEYLEKPNKNAEPI